MIKLDWLSADVLLIPSSVGLKYAGVEFAYSFSQEKKGPAALTNSQQEF
jgi:hypothetical protein